MTQRYPAKYALVMALAIGLLPAVDADPGWEPAMESFAVAPGATRSFPGGSCVSADDVTIEGALLVSQASGAGDLAIVARHSIHVSGLIATTPSVSTDDAGNGADGGNIFLIAPEVVIHPGAIILAGKGVAGAARVGQGGDGGNGGSVYLLTNALSVPTQSDAIVLGGSGGGGAPALAPDPNGWTRGGDGGAGGNLFLSANEKASWPLPTLPVASEPIPRQVDGCIVDATGQLESLMGMLGPQVDVSKLRDGVPAMEDLLSEVSVEDPGVLAILREVLAGFGGTVCSGADGASDFRNGIRGTSGTAGTDADAGPLVGPVGGNGGPGGSGGNAGDSKGGDGGPGGCLIGTGGKGGDAQSMGGAGGDGGAGGKGGNGGLVGGPGGSGGGGGTGGAGAVASPGRGGCGALFGANGPPGTGRAESGVGGNGGAGGKGGSGGVIAGTPGNPGPAGSPSASPGRVSPTTGCAG